MRRTLIPLLLALALLGVAATTASADDSDADPAAAADFQSPAANWLAPSCRRHGEAVFYSLSWGRLAQFLAADPSPCTDYYVSVPPRDVDKTQPRPGEAAKIRALGPRFHALAEFSTAAWGAWVRAAPDRTWGDAGREFRRRMAAAGFDVPAGDGWSLNELGADVVAGTGTARADAAAAIEALAAGVDGMPYAPGTVFVVAQDQRATDLTRYAAQLDSWLADSAFWTALEQPVRFFAQEAYADARAWGVAGSSRNERARALEAYLGHVPLRAAAGGDATAAATAFLDRTFVPLLNATWRGNGFPDFGWTQVDLPTMESFVSEQVYATHHFAQSHPQLAPDGRIGFAYVQRKLPSESQPDYNAKSALLLQRLAGAISTSYAQGGGSPVGACDGGWCDGYPVDGAAFVDTWDALAG